MAVGWNSTSNIGGEYYTCGYCSKSVAPHIGYTEAQYGWRIFICPNCGRPTFWDRRDFVPGTPFGNAIGKLEKKIEALYEEVRRCTAARAFTAAVLACRKLLMHAAVDKGSPEGQTFMQYVEFLQKEHYIPPGAKGWVDIIRTKGNEANHEIVVMTENEAKNLVILTEFLLKTIYELPGSVPKES